MATNVAGYSGVGPVPNLPNYGPEKERILVGESCTGCWLGSSCCDGDENNCPKNGEWDTSGDCSSYTCSGGTRSYCKRISYNADPVQCCVQGRSTIGSVTCDPKYRGSFLPDCQPIMKQYCDNRTNFFTPECQAWLKDIAPTQKGTADQLGNKYCPGSDDPFCACYNITMPPDLKDSAKGIFRCLDASCSGNQQALNTIDCPSAYVDCSIDASVVLNQSTAQKITIANNCGVDNSPSPSPSPTPSPSPSPSPTPSNDVTQYVVFGIAGLIAMLIIIGLIILLTQKKK
jgi:hypothetical protein